MATVKTMATKCPICKAFFTFTSKTNKTRIKYCSPACLKKAHKYKSRGIYDKVCKVCNKPFKTIYTVQEYCSTSCQKSVGHKQYIKKKGYNTKACLFCKATFKTTSKKKKYCSTDCYKIAKKKRDADFYFNKKLKNGEL